MASSHLNLALRCIKANVSTPVGDLESLMEEGSTLRDVVLNGHRWWILPETVPKKDLLDISLWRNMDQHENQSVHEIEILQSIKSTAKSLSEKQARPLREPTQGKHLFFG